MMSRKCSGKHQGIVIGFITHTLSIDDPCKVVVVDQTIWQNSTFLKRMCNFFCDDLTAGEFLRFS
jgi:hypothetical protein